MRDILRSWLVLALLAGCVAVHGEKAAVLPELKKPVYLAVDDKHVYISEQAKVFIYTLPDYRLLAQFGREGQGPQEFQTLPHIPVSIDVSTDQLIVASMRKISRYKKTGEYLDETKAVSLALELKPLGNSFIGWSNAKDKDIVYAVISQYDGELTKQKELYRLRDSFQGKGRGYRMLNTVFTYSASPDFALIPGADDRSLDLLDKHFNKVRTLRVEGEPLPVTADFKEKIEHHYKTSPETKEAYPFIQPLIFPDHFPVIADFFIAGDLIYVMTWQRDGKGNVFHVYNLEGGFKGKATVPIVYETDIKPYPVFIRDKKLFQLVEGAGEDWELHVAALKF